MKEKDKSKNAEELLEEAQNIKDNKNIIIYKIDQKREDRIKFYQKRYKLQEKLFGKKVATKGKVKYEKVKYNYSTKEDIMSTIEKEIKKSKLVFDIYYKGNKYREKKGKYGPEDFIEIKIFLKVTDIETGYSEKYTYEGSGQDNGDKAIYKAQTGAQKYAYTKFFHLKAGEVEPETEIEIKGEKFKISALLKNFKERVKKGKKVDWDRAEIIFDKDEKTKKEFAEFKKKYNKK